MPERLRLSPLPLAARACSTRGLGRALALAVGVTSASAFVIGCGGAAGGTSDTSDTSDTGAIAEGGTSADAAPSDGPGADASLPAPTFGACPAGYFDECATLAMPLDHGAAFGETIDFLVARRRAKTTATRQVWLLAGGPGQAGYVYGSMLDAIGAFLPDADLYVVDHRGTGHSHRLACPQQDQPGTYGGYSLDPSLGDRCLAKLPAGDLARLPYFTTRQAALDVTAAIEAVRTPGQKVYVWGESYGTHWAHRVLQVARPGAIDGVVFDGFMTPEKFAFTHYDHGVEEAGEAFAGKCDADPTCSGYLPGGALAKLRAVLDKLQTTACGSYDHDTARTLVSVFMDGPGTRTWIFPLVHRLDRCTSDDIKAIDTLVSNYDTAASASVDTTPFVNSGVLQYNIALAELWKLPGEPDPTLDALDAAAAAQAFLAGTSFPASLLPLRTTWPIAPDDASALPVPVTLPPSTHLLFLAGELDTRTPKTQAQAITALYPAQAFVMIPGAAHTPSSASPLASDATESCGQKIIAAFVEGDGKVDTSCFSDLVPVRFSSPTQAFAKKWWGTVDDWGDGRPPAMLRRPIDGGAAASARELDVRPSSAALLAWTRVRERTLLRAR